MTQLKDNMTNIEKIRQEIERRKGYISVTHFAEELLAFIDSLPDEDENHGCGVEFPYFGANYPDAKCIDGYLWDMDSYEDGVYTIGGDDPCPICNTEKWLKDVLDDELFKTRDEALEYVKMLKSKYKHKDSLPEEKTSEDLEEETEMQWDSFNKHLADCDSESEEVVWLNWNSFKDVAYDFYVLGKQSKGPVSHDLEEAAKEYSERVSGGHNYRDLTCGFIAGAKWQANQLLKGSPLPEDTVLFQKGVE